MSGVYRSHVPKCSLVIPSPRRRRGISRWTPRPPISGDAHGFQDARMRLGARPACRVGGRSLAVCAGLEMTPHAWGVRASHVRRGCRASPGKSSQALGKSWHLGVRSSSRARGDGEGSRDGLRVLRLAATLMGPKMRECVSVSGRCAAWAGDPSPSARARDDTSRVGRWASRAPYDSLFALGLPDAARRRSAAND